MRMAHQHHIKRRLGIPEKMPADYTLEPTFINVADGNDPEIITEVWIVPRSPKQFHRVMVRCPGCGSEMSMGRLNQHYATKLCQKRSV